MNQDENATGVPLRINNESSMLPSEQAQQAHTGTTPEQPSDEILMAQVARSNSDALEALYDRYASTVFGVALKVIGDQPLAEDVLQETFWRVWQNAATYQSQRGTFTSWLFRIARNLAIDAYRRRNVRPQVLNAADSNK